MSGSATKKENPTEAAVVKLEYVAERLGVSEYTARRRMNAGLLPDTLFPPPAVPQWRRSDIIAWLGMTS
jgi:predicted DNA-binding transcriptional regulator AlpA